MTDLDVVLSKLKSLETSVEKLSDTVNTIAVQDERIGHIDNKTSKLFDLHDKEFGPEGVISKIQKHQNQCPKKEVEELKDDLKTMRSNNFRITFALIFAYIGGSIGIIASLLK